MAKKKKKKTDPAPAAPPPAAGPAPKGGPLLAILTVLLILIGIADLFLWGLAGYYLIQSTRSQPSGGTVQSAPAGGTTAQSLSAAGGTLPQNTPSGGAASPAPPTPPSAGGDGAAAREALEAYIQSLSTAFQLDNQMQESYQSVAGTNYTDDETTYTEISERTLPLCQQLNEAVLAITPSDPEISQLHGIFRDYVTKYVNALSMLTSAIVDQDTSQLTQANDLINEASDLVVSYHQTLQTLASQRGVSLNI